MSYWKKEEKRRKASWEKSKDKKFVVRMNIGCGLWKNVIEVRHTEYDDLGEYWCKDGDTNYNSIEPSFSSGNREYGFDTKKQAQLFLDGARAYRDFMSQFFISQGGNSDD